MVYPKTLTDRNFFGLHSH